MSDITSVYKGLGRYRCRDGGVCLIVFDLRSLGIPCAFPLIGVPVYDDWCDYEETAETWNVNGKVYIELDDSLDLVEYLGPLERVVAPIPRPEDLVNQPAVYSGIGFYFSRAGGLFEVFQDYSGVAPLTEFPIVSVHNGKLYGHMKTGAYSQDERSPEDFVFYVGEEPPTEFRYEDYYRKHFVPNPRRWWACLHGSGESGSLFETRELAEQASVNVRENMHCDAECVEVMEVQQ